MPREELEGGDRTRYAEIRRGVGRPRDRDEVGGREAEEVEELSHDLGVVLRVDAQHVARVVPEKGSSNTIRDVSRKYEKQPYNIRLDHIALFSDLVHAMLDARGNDN